MPASYRAIMTVPANRDQVFQACLEAIAQCGFHVVESKPGSGQIKARSRASHRSLVEEITITFSREDSIDITSSSPQIEPVDNGKNMSNVNALIYAIDQLLPHFRE